jgi:hypothetical protein
MHVDPRDLEQRVVARVRMRRTGRTRATRGGDVVGDWLKRSPWRKRSEEFGHGANVWRRIVRKQRMSGSHKL